MDGAIPPPDREKCTAILNSLHDILPASHAIRSSFYLTADSILNAVLAAGLKVALTKIGGADLAEWDDTHVAQIIFNGYRAFHRGRLIMHLPHGWRNDLPDVECEAAELSAFIDGYEEGSIFDGDAIFLAPESRTLTVFHHEVHSPIFSCPEWPMHSGHKPGPHRLNLVYARAASLTASAATG